MTEQQASGIRPSQETFIELTRAVKINHLGEVDTVKLFRIQEEENLMKKENRSIWVNFGVWQNNLHPPSSCRWRQESSICSFSSWRASRVLRLTTNAFMSKSPICLFHSAWWFSEGRAGKQALSPPPGTKTDSSMMSAEGAQR